MTLEGLLCEHWLQNDGTSLVHIYVDSANQGDTRIRIQAGVGVPFCC